MVFLAYLLLKGASSSSSPLLMVKRLGMVATTLNTCADVEEGRIATDGEEKQQK
jgi:hypothetical protein